MKFWVEMEAVRVRPFFARLRCSNMRAPPGMRDTSAGCPRSPGAMDHSHSTSAVFMGRSFSMISTSIFFSSRGLALGTTCTSRQPQPLRYLKSGILQHGRWRTFLTWTLSNSWSAKMSRSARRPSSVLYSWPTLKGSSRRTMSESVSPPFFLGLPLSSTYTTLMLSTWFKNTPWVKCKLPGDPAAATIYFSNRGGKAYPALNDICHYVASVHAIKMGDVSKGKAPVLVPALNDVLDVGKGLDCCWASGVGIHHLPQPFAAIDYTGCLALICRFGLWQKTSPSSGHPR